MAPPLYRVEGERDSRHGGGARVGGRRPLMVVELD
jgi:hypothetical protein